MVCTLEELRSKDVINVVNGENLGRIDDLQMNAQTAYHGCGGFLAQGITVS